QTGCDGVALGRIGAARPFCAARWLEGRKADLADYSLVAEMLCQSLTEHFGPPHDFSHLKKISPYFCANFLYGHGLDKKIRCAKDMDQACKIFEEFFLADPPINELPNPHLFN
ncbi:MAG: tRNA-dihydrouridine synthase family protein, partial [Desulfatibacillaceae bacterium]|nr:tRNA-dihydrouridine synthase family protein [Desulfatibacillaceae bacterium]